MNNPQRFRAFIARFSELIDGTPSEERIFAEGMPLLADLVRHDDWLPESCARESAEGYRQYLLYCDPRERFSVVSFVWGPGQRTPIHDHTVWGMVGILRGAELCEEYDWPRARAPMRAKGVHRVVPGDVDKVSPTIGDVHVVANALTDRPSISIHVYGANIGAVQRHVFDRTTGAIRPFVSGYHNTTLPNFWDRSAEVRASLVG
jgi:predicted metal-dependent enzyme (double-stranded beta helix superfamily)